MSRYIITSITMHNFKVFDNFKIDFEDSSLITFGGPNGYGKTTVFDAVELALTGDIKRFTIIDKSSGNRDNIVARNPNELVWIEITLSDGDNIVEIKRVLKVVSSRKEDNKVSNFKNLWKLKKISDAGEEDITQESFEELIGEKRLSEYYNNFFYIQQEETAHFLKQDEKKRLETIAELFNMQKEERELTGIKQLKEKISNIKDRTKSEKDRLSEKLDLGNNPNDEIGYKQLLHWYDSPKGWDKEELNFPNLDTKTQYFFEVNRIKKILIHKEEIQRYYWKDFYSYGDDIIKAFLLGHNFWARYEETLDIYDEKKKIEKFQNKLDKLENILSDEWSFSLIEEQIEFNYDDIKEKVEELKILNTNTSLNDNILRELMVLRSDLIEKFKESNLDENNCPLCGSDSWEKTERLFDAIENKKKFIESLLEDDSQRFQKKLDEFNEEKDKLKILIFNYLDNEKYNMDDSYIIKLKSIKEKEQLSKNMYSFLGQNNIDIEELTYNSLDIEINEDELISKVTSIKDRFDSIAFSEVFVQDNEEYHLVSVYGEYGDDRERIFELGEEDINNKLSYIEQEYYKYNKEKKEKVDELINQIEQLKTLLGNINSLIGIYKDKIALQRKKIIKDIEIPFYIYSGKILQSVRGNNTTGIYIKDSVRGADNKINNIRFVSSWDSDQDVINTSSSGQLAGIVIALTLTLNMVYSQNFNAILIDDPIQSMDDINMISFIELLRNDFKDKQIFISTHEESIEKYILYKFIKHQQSVCRINVMKKEIHHKSGN